MSNQAGVRYVLDEDNVLKDIETGELIDNDEIIHVLQDERDKEFVDKTNQMIALGYKDLDRIVKYKGVTYPCKTVKEKYTYGKVFRVALREIMKDGKLSLNARAFIATFEPYISFPYNCIIVGVQYPSQQQIEEMLGLKRASVYSILKELEYYDIIKRVKANNTTVIYFNPFLYASGGIIHCDTYNLFESSVFNPKNSNQSTTD